MMSLTNQQRGFSLLELLVASAILVVLGLTGYVALNIVLRVAEEADSNLIVVGSHDPAARDYLIGSNAAKIVRHSHCSVYVVR